MRMKIFLTTALSLSTWHDWNIHLAALNTLKSCERVLVHGFLSRFLYNTRSSFTRGNAICMGKVYVRNQQKKTCCFRCKGKESESGILLCVRELLDPKMLSTSWFGKEPHKNYFLHTHTSRVILGTCVCRCILIICMQTYAHNMCTKICVSDKKTNHVEKKE